MYDSVYNTNSIIFIYLLKRDFAYQLQSALLEKVK